MSEEAIIPDLSIGKQLLLFDIMARRAFPRPYLPVLTVTKNRKGVLDVDTVKGCTLGMAAYPRGGCYGECYAYKIAKFYGFDFSISVSRKFMGREHINTIEKIMDGYDATWYRIGTYGDPCHDWDNTLVVCRSLRHTKKTPVIITKHWVALSDDQVIILRGLGAVINTSMSGMDSESEISYRVGQMNRLKELGLRSVCRVITCKYGSSDWARACADKQDYLLSLAPVIDNPLRVRKSNPRVIARDIFVSRRDESVGGWGRFISLNCTSTYLGICAGCPDQCGVDASAISNMEKEYGNEDQATGTLPF